MTHDRPEAANGGPQPSPSRAAPQAPPDGGDAAEAERTMAEQLRLAFAPLHKRAFGIAVGTACGLVVAVATIAHLIRDPQEGPNIHLLAQYFYGYRVSPAGVVIGALWGFAVGFIAGWFVAFTRNLAVAIAVFVTRTRAELRATRDFLDHI